MVEIRTIGDDGTAEQLIRYQIGNHLGSASVELDPGGQIISYEEYFPYGSTSYQAVNAAIKAAKKRYRYTGMERDDETGLAYHSARSYATWLGRWTSSDPAGLVETLNSYVYASNSPTRQTDSSGYQSQDEIDYPPGVPTPGEIIVYGQKEDVGKPDAKTANLGIGFAPVIIVGSSASSSVQVSAPFASVGGGSTLLGGGMLLGAFLFTIFGIGAVTTKTADAFVAVKNTDNPELLWRFDRKQYYEKYGHSYPPELATKKIPVSGADQKLSGGEVSKEEVKKPDPEPELQPEAGGAGAIIGGGCLCRIYYRSNQRGFQNHFTIELIGPDGVRIETHLIRNSGKVFVEQVKPGYFTDPPTGTIELQLPRFQDAIGLQRYLVDWSQELEKNPDEYRDTYPYGLGPFKRSGPDALSCATYVCDIALEGGYLPVDPALGNKFVYFMFNLPTP
jgi:RHS repeat-associated protein